MQHREESEYINKTTKKSSWTPKEGSNRWLDQYIQKVKNDVIKNLKQEFKINITKGVFRVSLVF
jgi:LPS O-antigen subunit length determinant protein (WzzB/FepE family)